MSRYHNNNDPTQPVTHESVSAGPTQTRPFLDSTDLLNDPEALRERAQAEGYLFFKQLLPAEDLLPVRDDLLDVVDAHGWLDRNHPKADGIVDLDALNKVGEKDMRTDIGVSTAMYDEVQKLYRVHKLPHHPNLLRVYETLFGKEVLVHPRHIVRMVTPHRTVSPTPPHQDHPLIQGTQQTWTCWFPVADCPKTLGGLTVLQASQKLGCLPIQPAKGAGGITSSLCPHDGEGWAEGDFEAGDVLTFTSTTVHKALKCQFPNRIRLSFDVRYQPADQDVESRSLLPHCELNWEEIYATWPDTAEADALKYYWHKYTLEMSEYDESLRIPGRRIC